MARESRTVRETARLSEKLLSLRASIIIFRAYYWVITHWSSVMQKRRATQALRKVGDRDLLRHTDFRLDFGQAGQGWATRLAQMVFDPLFFLLRQLALVLVWW